MPVSLKRTSAGVCDHCGLWWLHAIDSPCFHCHVGTFKHRSLFWFNECCGDPQCERCHGSSVRAEHR